MALNRKSAFSWSASARPPAVLNQRRLGVRGRDRGRQDAARCEEGDHLRARVVARDQAGHRFGRQRGERLVGDGGDLGLVVGDEVDENRQLLVGARREGALGGEQGDFGVDVAPDEALEQRHGGHGSGGSWLPAGGSKAWRRPDHCLAEPPPQIVHRPRRVEEQSNRGDTGGPRLRGRGHRVERYATDGKHGHPDGRSLAPASASRPVGAMAARLRARREDGSEDHEVCAFGSATTRLVHRVHGTPDQERGWHMATHQRRRDRIGLEVDAVGLGRERDVDPAVPKDQAGGGVPASRPAHLHGRGRSRSIAERSGSRICSRSTPASPASTRRSARGPSVGGGRRATSGEGGRAWPLFVTRQMHGRGRVTVARPPGCGRRSSGSACGLTRLRPARRPPAAGRCPETAPRAQPDCAMSTAQVAAIWMNALRSHRPDHGTISRTNPASTR